MSAAYLPRNIQNECSLGYRGIINAREISSDVTPNVMRGSFLSKDNTLEILVCVYVCICPFTNLLVSAFADPYFLASCLRVYFFMFTCVTTNEAYSTP